MRCVTKVRRFDPLILTIEGGGKLDLELEKWFEGNRGIRERDVRLFLRVNRVKLETLEIRNFFSSLLF